MKKLLILIMASGCISLYAANNKKTVKHVVQPVENLYRISLVHNTTVKDILQANPGLDPQKLKVGSRLIVPENTQPTASNTSKAPAGQVETNAEELSPFMGNNAAILRDADSKTKVEVADDKARANDIKSDESHVSFDSEELKARYNELLRLQQEDKSITIVDMNKIKVNPVVPSSESAELVDELQNHSKVYIMNLQVVLKDGTVKTFTDPQEQKKMLSEITSDLSIK